MSGLKLGLQGKKVFITGSTLGIGYGCAKTFLLEGAHVYVNGRTLAKVEEAIAKLRDDLKKEGGNEEYGKNLFAVPGDVSKPEEATSICQQLPQDLDVLVCNVGIFSVKDFDKVTEDEWLHYYNVNIMSTVRVCQHFLPLMLKRNQGRILIMSSEAALKPHPLMIHYSMTKAAQLSLARGMAEQTKGTGVTVNSILPGPTATEGLIAYFEGVAEKQGKTSEQAIKDYFRDVEPTSLIQRLLTVQEVANTVVFIASDAASGINGSAQKVEGGILRLNI